MDTKHRTHVTVGYVSCRVRLDVSLIIYRSACFVHSMYPWKIRIISEGLKSSCNLKVWESDVRKCNIAYEQKFSWEDNLQICWFFKEREIKFPFWPPKGSNPRNEFPQNVSKPKNCKLWFSTIQKSIVFLIQLPSTIIFVVQQKKTCSYHYEN